MVKVLYIADMLHTKSGITAVMMNYYRHMDKSNVLVDFLVPEGVSEQRLLDEVASCGSQVYFMPVLGASIGKIHRFKAFMDAFFSLHNDYVAVHSHFMQLNALVFPVAKRNGISCCISHSHLTKYSENKFHSIRNWIMCLPNDSVSTIWAACGVKAGEFLYGKGFLTSPKHMIVKNAIELSRFSFNEDDRIAVRDEFGICKDEVVLGTVGRLQAQKNQTFLLDVLDVLSKADKRSYRLVVVGEGPLENSLRERAETMGLEDCVIFAGRRCDANRMYQSFDVFLLPSLYEGLPVVGVEAQASGLPCVFSTGITNEVDIAGSLFLPIDKGPQVWAAAIEGICIPACEDRALTIDAVRNAGFDIAIESKRLENFYIGLADKRCVK